ncbi:MAG: nickel pincer cofactor biosynthesis protein LarC [Actinobacteria bacterium]|nr:nickel pincer cofactor biosynthesis protein LarC [Actinomycetota bacterium]MCL5882410.1 nickel pincer cofactor biosynthesis protein LarC [Actinomycetota bacterium]
MAGQTVYIDCFSGVAGDMFVGALLDAGAGTLEMLRRELAKIDLDGWSINTETVQVSGIAATRFSVTIEGEEQEPRSLSDIEELIASSELSQEVRSHCLAIFGRVARAEAKAHGELLQTVHFHEVGMVDSIIDIVSTCVLFEELKPREVYCSPVTLGSGTVQTRHGLMPVPSPATAVLLKGIPVLQGGERQELATPTGAALISYFARSFGAMPTMKLETVGYGAGTRETKGPNLLRMIIGERRVEAVGLETGGSIDEQVLMETNIDDTTPEKMAYLVEKLLEAEAADAWMSQVIMKKGRPGVVLSVLCPAEKLERLMDAVFNHSSTFGVRINKVERHCLERRSETVQTDYGSVRVKIGTWRRRDVTFSPEYEDCREAAERHGVPLETVYEAAKAAAAAG